MTATKQQANDFNRTREAVQFDGIELASGGRMIHTPGEGVPAAVYVHAIQWATQTATVGPRRGSLKGSRRVPLSELSPLPAA